MTAKYQADFPPENVTSPSLAHNTVHENLEVIQTAVISDRNAYDMELQRHIKASEEHEQKTHPRIHSEQGCLLGQRA